MKYIYYVLTFFAIGLVISLGLIIKPMQKRNIEINKSFRLIVKFDKSVDLGNQLITTPKKLNSERIKTTTDSIWSVRNTCSI